jgi:hypothetical protein
MPYPFDREPTKTSVDDDDPDMKQTEGSTAMYLAFAICSPENGTGTFLNKVVAYFTESDVIHVQLLFEYGEDFTITYSVDSSHNCVFSSKDKVFTRDVWRFYQIESTELQRRHALEFLNGQLGMPFNEFGVYLRIFPFIHNPHRVAWICSELATEALKAAKVEGFVEADENKMTPGNLEKLCIHMKRRSVIQVSNPVQTKIKLQNMTM